MMDNGLCPHLATSFLIKLFSLPVRFYKFVHNVGNVLHEPNKHVVIFCSLNCLFKKIVGAQRKLHQIP